MPKVLSIWTMISVAAVLTACGESDRTSTSSEPAPPPVVEKSGTSLAEAAEGAHRSDENKARNAFRHPVETLEFFGLESDMKVVEIWPAGGWYSEVIAPYMQENGRYIAAHWDPESEIEFVRNGVKGYQDKLAAHPEAYEKVEMAVLMYPDKMEFVPPGSVDMVLTFRNIHNWMARDFHDALLAEMYAALKPGGILGVVEHRGNPDVPQDPKAASGYVNQDYAIALAEKAGFVLEVTSEINANPKDRKDYETGVWTLPPTMRAGEENRDEYLAIGESDRFTLKFKKPEA
jgi:predicted methyltransferase